jgi:hypothetical protein
MFQWTANKIDERAPQEDTEITSFAQPVNSKRLASAKYSKKN